MTICTMLCGPKQGRVAAIDCGSHLAQALIHGLNRHYYSISINYRKNPLEEQMLLNLQKKSWQSGLTLR